MTVLRIHEHEDNPLFKDKLFTFEEYMDWYAKDRGDGHFTFDKQIFGFSIPGTWFKKFIRDFPRATWTEKEKAFIDMVRATVGKEIINSRKKFAIIATFGKNNGPDFKHELAHALYYIDDDYRKSANRLMRGVKIEVRKKLKAYLINMGYHDDEIKDEINARLSTDKKITQDGKVLVTNKAMIPFRQLLKTSMRQHMDGEKNEETS